MISTYEILLNIYIFKNPLKGNIYIKSLKTQYTFYSIIKSNRIHHYMQYNKIIIICNTHTLFKQYLESVSDIYKIKKSLV